MRRTCIACGTPIISGSRCTTHRLRNGSGTGWRKTRAEVLMRDGHVCQLRLDGCTGQATHVDHLTPLANGGTDDRANLVAACAHCNLAKGVA